VIRRGEVRWFRFTSPDKRRPVLVVGRDDVLPSLAQIPIIPLSTVARGLRWEVSLVPKTASRRRAC
jgi:mRNA interferase MazF